MDISKVIFIFTIKATGGYFWWNLVGLKWTWDLIFGRHSSQTIFKL